jgi:hypothetical protein
VPRVLVALTPFFLLFLVITLLLRFWLLVRPLYGLLATIIVILLYIARGVTVIGGLPGERTEGGNPPSAVMRGEKNCSSFSKVSSWPQQGSPTEIQVVKKGPGRIRAFPMCVVHVFQNGDRDNFRFGPRRDMLTM